MLGVKEICGLIFVLCCVSAHPVSKKDFQSQQCSAKLENDARKLSNRYNTLINKNSLEITGNRAATHLTGLPNCTSPKPWTIAQTYHVVMGFNGLFRYFKKTFNSQELENVLKQQEFCFKHHPAPGWTRAPIAHQPRNVTAENSMEFQHMSFYYAVQYYNECLAHLSVSGI